MGALDYWELAKSYTVAQAALLFCGENPTDYKSLDEGTIEYRVPHYYPVLSALEHAISDRDIEAQVSFVNNEYGESSYVDIHKTRLSRAVLDDFFESRGVQGHFFGRSSRAKPIASPQLPLKLNAALRAWTAVTSEPSLLRGRSPKQALREWLTDHADELGLINRSGDPNTTGIEEICKVANWKPEGGATPTPGPLPAPAPAPAAVDDDLPPDFYDLDDEIPF